MTQDILCGHSPEVMDLIRHLGFLPNEVSRVVLDIPADGPAKAYIEKYFSKKIIKVLSERVPLGIEIVEVP